MGTTACCYTLTTPQHSATMEAEPQHATALDELEQLQIVSHPLVSVKVAELRNVETRPARFRQLIGEITTMLGLEASRTLALQPVEGLQSPLGPYQSYQLAQRIGLAPILRAGISMTDPMLSLFPSASVFHLGLYRDKSSFTPTEYYSKLPVEFKKHVDVVYLLDPVVATGGTACAAVAMLQDAGLPIANIKLLCVIASMPGLRQILSECPGLEIYCAAVDQVLNDQGFISPGIGDAGDRIFSTME